MLSWISQNYFFTKWDEKIEKLKMSQQFIMTETVQKVQYENMMYSLLNDSLRNLAKVQYIKKATNIVFWSKARISDGSMTQKAYRERDSIVNLSITAFVNEKYNILDVILNDLRNSTTKSFNSNLDIYEQQYLLSLRKIEFFNSLFLFLYLIGSLMLGLQWLNEKKICICIK